MALRALRYFGSESDMSKALNERGELTHAGKAALAAAYPDLCERLGVTSQGAIGKALGGFTQAAVSKAKKGEAGRQMAEAVAGALGLDLDGLLAKYGPPSPELIRLRDPRYPNLETAAAMAIAEFGKVIDEVFEERGQRDNDASVDEWLRSIHARYRTHGQGLKVADARRPNVGGKIATPWKE